MAELVKLRASVFLGRLHWLPLISDPDTGVIYELLAMLAALRRMRATRGALASNRRSPSILPNGDCLSLPAQA